MDMKDLMTLTKEDWNMLVEGVDSLKSRGLAGELMGSLFETALAPKKGASEEELKSWEKHKEKREAGKKLKEEEEERFKQKAELLKAKLVLMRENIQN